MSNNNSTKKLKRGPIFSALKKVVSLFKKKIEVVNLSGEPLDPRAIYISNHAGANGPLSYEIYFPNRLTIWGAHEMCEGIKSRWNYLYHVFYIQKLHWSKFKAFVIATLFCPISRLVYGAIGLIPTYKDSRFIESIKRSVKVLDANTALLIFPEDSEKGYLNPPESLHDGFIAIANVYQKLRGVSLPVYPCYFFAKSRKIIVAEPIDVIALKEKGFTEDEVKNIALQSMQNLYYDETSGK